MSKSSSDNDLRIAVVGGGITGLAAAHRLGELHPSAEINLIEASDRLGGVIRTHVQDDLRVELGPDMFTTKDAAAVDLCEQLGMKDELIPTNEANRGAYILRSGRLYPVPEGFSMMAPQRIGPLLKSGLLTPLGKLRLLAERWTLARKEDGDESLQSFAVRRFGNEAYQWLIQPLISGIYTADPERLSMQATMKEFVDMERNYGSLIRAVMRARRSPAKNGAQRNATGARYGLFLAPREGMEALVKRLEASLSSVRIQRNRAVESITRADSDRPWIVRSSSGTETYDRVLLALPAFQAANVIADQYPQLAQQLEAIEYASTAVVCLVLNRDQINRPIKSFGVVVPMAEQRSIIAVSFANLKFAGRAPDSDVIMRIFIGGACQSELLAESDDELIQRARREVGEILDVNFATEPSWQHVVRWNRCMPQYHLGHLDRVAAIEHALADIPGLEFAGNALHGVGIPACINSGRQAAERLLERAAASPACEDTNAIER